MSYKICDVISFVTQNNEQTVTTRRVGVVMGIDPCSESCGFESHHRTLDVHFFTHICCKNWYVCLNRRK